MSEHQCVECRDECDCGEQNEMDCRWCSACTEKLLDEFESTYRLRVNHDKERHEA